MAQYIDKSALVAEIERLSVYLDSLHEQRIVEKILSIIDTLEVKEVETWHLQEKEDIYDAVNSSDIQTFVCIMKDGTIQRFSGFLDEDCEGHINVHIDGVNDDYGNVDDIVKWIEYT